MAGQRGDDGRDQPDGQGLKPGHLQRALLALTLFVLVFCALVGLYAIGMVRTP